MKLAEANAELKKKLKKLGFTNFEMKPGQEDVLMLHVQGRFICSVEYALDMPSEQLKVLIAETLEVA
jgi:hypothetical protein